MKQQLVTLPAALNSCLKRRAWGFSLPALRPWGQKRGEDTGRGSRARLSLGAAMFVRKLQLKEQSKRGKFPAHFFTPF